MGGEVLDGQFKPHLVVALAGAAVADGVGALGLGDLDNPLGDDGPREGSAQQVALFIDRPGLEGREDEIVYKLLLEVFDIEFGGTACFRPLLQPFQLGVLADVAGDADDLAVIVMLLQPRDDDRGIEAAGVGKYDFFFFFYEKTLPFCIGNISREKSGL